MSWGTVFVLISPTTIGHLASVSDESAFALAEKKLKQHSSPNDAHAAPEQWHFDCWDPETFGLVTDVAKEDWPPLGIITRDSVWVEPSDDSFDEAVEQVRNPALTERVVSVLCHW